MNPIYHLLGSNIPHHNHQLLTFFQTELSPRLTGQTHIFYVVGEEDLNKVYPLLEIRRFSSKKAIVKAAVAEAKQPNARFVLHGQFNLPLWFALWCGELPVERCYWHVWGADLYEDSADWRFRLIYPLRRLAQNKLPVLWATEGDLVFAKMHLRRDSSGDRLLYFPTRMLPQIHLPEKRVTEEVVTVLLGNSGDRSNRHLSALAQIKQALGGQVRIIVPMGYPANNRGYIEKVKREAAKFFPQNAIEILDETIDFERYLEILTRCDVGYFNFERQQGIGTICQLTQLNIPIVLRRENPFTADMRRAKIPFIYPDELSSAEIQRTRQELMRLDKSGIAFFAPNYTVQWLELLTEISEKKHD